MYDHNALLFYDLNALETSLLSDRSVSRDPLFFEKRVLIFCIALAIFTVLISAYIQIIASGISIYAGNEKSSFYRWIIILIILEFVKILCLICLHANLSYENPEYTIIIRYTLFAVDTLWLIWQVNGNFKYYNEWSVDGNITFIVQNLLFPFIYSILDICIL